MTGATQENGDFSTLAVPPEQQGSGWRIFFIIAGSVCALPVFILGAQVSAALGLQQAVLAVLLATTLLAVLAGLGAAVGSATRMNLAMLTDLAFGTRGAWLVKLAIAVSLAGWFGVNISVLGAATAGAIGQMGFPAVTPPMVSIPVSLLIAGVALRGVHGLERLGQALLPLAFCLLLASVWMVRHNLATAFNAIPTGALGFGAVVSAVIGSYIVGVMIQPDYGRFIRRPPAAFAGAGLALGLVFPLMLLGSALAPMVTGKPDLIAAMILLGLGLPALAVLLLGAWIDASACLYSAGLSLANLLPRLGFRPAIIGIALLGVVLALAHADQFFIPFLVSLGVVLPPVAAVQIVHGLVPQVRTRPMVALRPGALVAWAGGIMAGLAAGRSPLSSGIAAVDSILVAATLSAMFLWFSFARARKEALSA